MQNQEIVTLAVQSQEFKENSLTNVKLAELAGFNTEEIEFVKLFWGPAFNESWIYVTKNMVVEWFGYKDSKDTMSDFYKKLNKDYEKDTHFKEVEQTDEIIKEAYSENTPNGKLGNRAKYYVITGDCLKTLLMTSQTLRGKVVRKIYLKTEKLVTIMLEVINTQSAMIKDLKIEEQQKLLNTKDKLLIAASQKNLKLDNKILNVKPYEEDGWVYITTNDMWANSNMFRIGRSIDLDNRIRKYSVGKSSEEEHYYVFFYKTRDYITLEYLLRSTFSKFRENPKKDQYILHLSILLPAFKKICYLFDKNIMKIANSVIKDNIEIIIEPESSTEMIYNKNDVIDLIDMAELKNFKIIETDEDSIADVIKTDIIGVREELITSDEDIDDLPKKQLRDKAIRRNIFINKMKLVNLRVVSPYKTIEHSISLMCNENHIFDIIPNNVNLSTTVCYICQNVEKTLEATKLVSSRGMKCLNYAEKKFRCANGHNFIPSTLNYILYQNGGCKTCNKKDRLTKDHYHEVAKANNGTWVDNNLDAIAAPSSSFETDWICSKGHAFKAKYQRAYAHWNAQCEDCKPDGMNNHYMQLINKIINVYPTARLLTPKIIKITDSITFICSHYTESWNVGLKGFLQKSNWKCKQCKNNKIIAAEDAIDDKLEQEEMESDIEVDDGSNIYYNLAIVAVNKYNADLLTPIKDITDYKSNIAIQCIHKIFTTKVNAIVINNSWNCIPCKSLYKK